MFIRALAGQARHGAVPQLHMRGNVWLQCDRYMHQPGEGHLRHLSHHLGVLGGRWQVDH